MPPCSTARRARCRFFLDPTGEQIGETLCEDEGILYADIDLNKCVEPKQFHDVVGYYNRFDVFDLSINRRRLVPATFINDAPLVAAADDAGDDTGRAPQPARIGF